MPVVGTLRGRRAGAIASLLVGALVGSFLAAPARALETDQFTVPDRPLADIGPHVDAYVMATVWDVVQAANGKAAWHARQARRTPWVFWKQYHRGKAEQFGGDEYLARRVYEALAGGSVPECRIELWVRQQRFRGADPNDRALFNLTCARGVYGNSIFTKPLLLVDLSPTVNVHGSYMGLDKLGHLFQQGYDYYRRYRSEELRGRGGGRALASAVRLGVAQERGIYGEALIGVYSNADLAANYAGLQFYLNLTRTVRVGTCELPPLLVRGERKTWVLNPARADAGGRDVLRPFVSDHFNEALNPSRYCDQMRATVRANLRRRARRLVAFYGTTAEEARARQLELSTWHGAPYGHSRFPRVVTMADNCFPAEVLAGAQPAGRRAGARTGAGAPTRPSARSVPWLEAPDGIANEPDAVPAASRVVRRIDAAAEIASPPSSSR